MEKRVCGIAFDRQKGTIPCLFKEAQGPEENIRKPSVFLDFTVHLAKGDFVWMGFALEYLQHCPANRVICMSLLECSVKLWWVLDNTK